jgi:hypothetical protein
MKILLTKDFYGNVVFQIDYHILDYDSENKVFRLWEFLENHCLEKKPDYTYETLEEAYEQVKLFT